MATVDGADEHDLLTVAKAMRAGDLREFLAVSFADDKDGLIDDLALRYGSRDDLIGAFVDGRPVAVGAAIQARPNVLSLLFFATDEFAAAALRLTKFITRELFPRYRAAGVHRIEAVSIEGNADAHRWLETLGLAEEVRLPGHGKNGEAFIQFAWVADHVCTLGS